MGAGAPGFTAQALRFHHAADRISEAARGHDMRAVLSALSDTLATCTGCHAAFKQKVVDEATWASLTGGAEPHRP
jgi:cytochrome c556